MGSYRAQYLKPSHLNQSTKDSLLPSLTHCPSTLSHTKTIPKLRSIRRARTRRRRRRRQSVRTRRRHRSTATTRRARCPHVAAKLAKMNHSVKHLQCTPCPGLRKETGVGFCWVKDSSSYIAKSVAQSIVHPKESLTYI